MFVALIIFFAIFVQSSAGFGTALVAMPLLVGVLGIRVATPLVALISLTTGAVMVFRYRAAYQFHAVVRLSIASAIGIPLGVYFLRRVDARIVTQALGVILILYALYALLNFGLPQLANRAWAYGFGFIAGLLGGAYNTSGPPVIIYANCRGWQPAEFKGNLQGFFLVNSVIVIAAHALSGNFTPTVLQNYLIALPAMALGLLAGFSLDNRINPLLFRKLILILLLVLGVRLVMG